MAVRDSVTESIAALTIGMLRSIPRHRRVRTSTSFGSTSLYAGTSRTSSNVSASRSLSSSMSLYSAVMTAWEGFLHRAARGARALTLGSVGVSILATLALALGLLPTRPMIYGEAEVLFEASRIRDHLTLF